MKNYNEILTETRAWAEEVFAKIEPKCLAMAKRSRDFIPSGVKEDGMHRPVTCLAWTGGFFGATNFILYNHTGNEEYLKTAQKQEELMSKGLERPDELDHDVGFMLHLLQGNNYRLTGNESSKLRNLTAAALLSSRYVLNGGFIKAWNDGYWRGIYNKELSIIDCMMNLPLLYWASETIGDDRFKQIAMAHADMALVDHLREDGSVVHMADHDREKGTVVRTWGGQGYCEGSSWSRGQAWGLYGFVLSYIYTKEERYLTAAKLISNYFIANCCDDWLPRVDFRAPSQPVYYDSTAGACAACGLIELAKLLPEHEGGMYMHAAVKMLKAMEKSFMNYDMNTDELLGYGTTLYPVKGTEKVHESIIYGDYFFIEALLKLLGQEFLPW